MKNAIIFLFLSCLFFSCREKVTVPEKVYIEKNGFLINTDTINLDLKEFVRPSSILILINAVKVKNKYYCFFIEDQIYNRSNKGARLFLIFTESGDLEHFIETPKEIRDITNFDLFVRNDSIIIKSYMRNYETFYFNTENLSWEQIEEAEDVIYEDENYYITLINYGEWGFTTWFKDKKTDKEYELVSKGYIVNKIDSSYYITDKHQILKVDNPLNLRPCDPDYYYHIAKQRNRFYMRTNYSLEGAEIVYKDSIYRPLTHWWEDMSNNIEIQTSFIYNNELFHLCSDRENIYISKLENMEFIPIVIFENFPHNLFEGSYSLRYKSQPNKTQLLKFETKDFNVNGLFEINGNMIDIHYIKHNVDSVKHIGKDSFAEVFDFIYENIDSLHLYDLNSFEERIGGSNLKAARKGGLHESYYPNKNNFDFEGVEVYLKVQDSVIANTIDYHYTKEDSLVRIIFFEWCETKVYNEPKEIFHIEKENNETITRFQKKISEIDKIVTDKLKVNSNKINIARNRFEETWEAHNGVIVNLYYDNFKGYKKIRMVMYKE